MARKAAPRSAAGSDEDLMLRIQGDDIRAFEELYDRYSARAFGLTRAICGSSHHAEEALQDGFVAVWRSRGTFDCTRGSARSWLLAVIRRRSLDVMHRTRRDDALRESDDALGVLFAPDSTARDGEQHDTTDWVRGSLLRVPVTQRDVIVLAYFGGLNHTEIAARLQVPAGTVKGRMRLGLQKVRAEISPTGSPSSVDSHKARRALTHCFPKRT
jgi:RNA polymerase sigma-70 factor, ECF subfamily